MPKMNPSDTRISTSTGGRIVDIYRASVEISNHRLTNFAKFDQNSKLATPTNDVISVIIGTTKDDTILSRSVVHTRAPIGTKIPVQWSAGDDGVSLSWPLPTGKPVNWKIYRDRTFMTSTYGDSYMDRVSSRRIPHTYTVIGSQQVSTKHGLRSRPVKYQVAVPATDFTALGKKITDPEILTATANADIMPAFQHSSMRAVAAWQAFIEEQFASASDCPNSVIDGYAYFNGNDRGFATDPYDPDSFEDDGFHSKSKIQTTTQYHVGDSWDTTPYFGKYVGPTIAYDEDYNEVAHDQASDEGVYLDHWEGTQDYGERNIVAGATIPLCAPKDLLVPAINYEFYSRFSILGEFTVYTEHDQAPSHEMVYSSFSDDPDEAHLGCAYRFHNKGFGNLFPVAPNAIADITFNPYLDALPDCTIV